MLEMDQLALEAAEEMLCHGIVVGIALAGDALPDSTELQPGHHGINSTGKGIAHPFVGTQALDDGRIEPALSGGNAGNIAPRPDLGAQKREDWRRRDGCAGSWW